MTRNITVTPLRAPTVIDGSQAARTLIDVEDADLHGARVSARLPAACRALRDARDAGVHRCSPRERHELDQLVDEMKAGA